MRLSTQLSTATNWSSRQLCRACQNSFKHLNVMSSVTLLYILYLWTIYYLLFRKRHIANFFSFPALALDIRIEHRQHCCFSSATNVPICGATLKVAINEAQWLTVANNIIGDQWIITENSFAMPVCMHCTTHISCPFCIHTFFSTIALQSSTNIGDIFSFWALPPSFHHPSGQSEDTEDWFKIGPQFSADLEAETVSPLCDGRKQQYAAECRRSSHELRTTFSHAICHQPPALPVRTSMRDQWRWWGQVFNVFLCCPALSACYWRSSSCQSWRRVRRCSKTGWDGCLGDGRQNWEERV